MSTKGDRAQIAPVVPTSEAGDVVTLLFFDYKQTANMSRAASQPKYFHDIMM